MSFSYAIKDLAGACMGTVTGNNQREISYLLTDSRSLVFPEQSLFFALVSDRNNGHKYIKELYKNGVRCFVVSEDKLPALADATFIKVQNTLEALQAVAHFHRLNFKAPIIALTGSNGKTTVKEWIYQLVHTHFYVVRTTKSFNSKIGVPLSLWHLDHHHDLALIETGISTTNEMQTLANLILPDWGVITNIGDAHSEGFESLEQKLDEKLKLFKDCKKVFFAKSQTAIYKRIHETSLKAEKIFWSEDQTGTLNSVTCKTENGETKVTAQYKNVPLAFTLPFVEQASINNALLSLLVALELQIDPAVLVQRVQKLVPVEMRLEITEGVQGMKIIQDFYNSDQESVKIALEFMAHQKGGKQKILVLSAFNQILETPDLFYNVAKLVNQRKIDKVVLVGKSWKAHKNLFNAKTHYFKNTEELLQDFDVLKQRDALILLKGARKYRFEDVAKLLKKQLHTTSLEVNLKALEQNLNVYKQQLKPKTKIMAMVKASSYGAGSVEIATKLQFSRVDYLGVAYIEEGVLLRKSGITLPIMVMNPDVQGFAKMIKYKLQPELYNAKIVQQFIAALAAHHYQSSFYPVHIKLETGMQRLGFTLSEIGGLIKILKSSPIIKVQSLFTHLAAADATDQDEFTAKQVATFTQMSHLIETELGYTTIKHLLNSSGIARFPAFQFNMVRLGIGLYGVDPSQNLQKALRAVSVLKTKISHLAEINVGESVGYSRNFKAQRKTKVATLPIGYADGLYRRLGNGVGKVWVKGTRCSIIGNICMDMCMIDVTDVDVNLGDEIEIFGENILITEVAQWAETIPYEILTHIGQRVPRVYLQV